ncbi:PVC-type heme-binding CxxCH protein [Luteolibacter algae]|uniref:PVC-type heme-binding CxxCH protein n=2 Tax=Luteolibacter algae TaxID=454151 RepID=A0ABW5D3Q6_9BACT
MRKRNALTLSTLSLFSLAPSAYAVESFPAANGLERTLIAEQPLLKNPVSVSVDVDGTIYVTETARRRAADLDVRQFTKEGWVPRDLSLTTIEDKEKFFREQLNGTNKFGSQDLADHNKDGKIDIEDLTAISERIVRITDKDNDGTYDTSNVFAEGFNTEVTGIAAGVLAWRGDVYTTIAPDMWKLRDNDGDGKSDERKSLAHGFGIHIAYAGHDMHGLTLGPDGRIYWSIGDKGTNVTTEAGKNFYAPHTGSVLRCYPDGSGFEIYATGLRNPQEIAFDQYGNLFSVDNDSDQKGERERFLHITESSDSGWRCYYQYRGSDYNPWMEESLSVPSGEFQPAYITPTNGNYSDGPAGFAFNPGTALNEKYRNSFFVSEFTRGNIRSFKVKPKGATFEMTDEHIVLSGPMNIGMNFGPDGALYSADWAGGYPLNEKGAVWKLDDPSVAQTAIRAEVAKMLKEGPGAASTEELTKRLSHPDQRVRLDAQWELAHRGAKTELSTIAASDSSDQMAVIHALWGLAQLKAFDISVFEKCTGSKDPEIRAQAFHYASEALRFSPELSKVAERGINRAMEDDSPRVRYFAAMAAYKLASQSSLPAVIEMLANNDNRDAYLRHAGALALSVSGAEEITANASTHRSSSVRLAAAVALRRLSSLLVSKLLLDKNPQVVAEAAHAIYDEPAIPEAFPALAATLSLNPDSVEPTIRRAIAANRRLGDSASAATLLEYAQLEAAPKELRIAALKALASWGDGTELDSVDGRYYPLEPADKNIARRAFKASADELQNHPDKDISAGAAAVAKSLGMIADEKTLAKQALDTSLDDAPRLRALDNLNTPESKLFKKTALSLLKDPSPAIRTHAAALLMEAHPEAVSQYAKDVLENSRDITERQQIIMLLGKAKQSALLKPLLKKAIENPTVASGPYDPALLLELMEALPKGRLTELNEKLASLGDAGTHLASLSGGDPAIGEQIFNAHLAAQCTACHRIGDEGSEVGPPLTEIGKKGSAYILESLVAPQAKIASGYGMMSVTKKDGSSLAGALKTETEDSLILIQPDKSEAVVKAADIATRTEAMSPMPPMNGILTPREIRDIVAFLDLQK